MAIAKSIPRLSEAEYLEIERRAEIKSEYLGGEMFAMSGGTPLHSQIAGNLIRELGTKLLAGPCIVYTSDLRVKVEAFGLYTYPDVTVACGDPQLEDDQRDTLLNPTVIVEILSDSREAYDRGKKFEMYRQIPLLREYLLVSQQKAHIEQFIRQPSGEWLFRESAGMDAGLNLPSLGITIALASVFAKVEFPAS
jgi:Uma2 family endonuclease